jgi:hypothetical protein
VHPHGCYDYGTGHHIDNLLGSKNNEWSEGL